MRLGRPALKFGMPFPHGNFIHPRGPKHVNPGVLINSNRQLAERLNLQHFAEQTLLGLQSADFFTKFAHTPLEDRCIGIFFR